MKLLSLIVLMCSAIFVEAEVPVVQRIPGQPIRAVWSDGNVATLNFVRSVPNTLDFILQVTENMCAARSGDIVNVILSYRFDALAWLWEKHSDPEQVGHIVKSLNVGLFYFKIVTHDIDNEYPDLILGLPRDRVEFSNLDWLPGFEQGGPRPFAINGWMSEGAVFNSQTGVFENRIVSGVHGLHLKPTRGLSFELEKLDWVFNISYGYFSLLGNVVSWDWRNAYGPCQITFRPGITTDESNIEVETWFATLKEPMRPYLSGQDSLLTIAGPGFLKQLDDVQ